MDCLKIENPYFINATLQSDDERAESEVLSCYYKLYYKEWAKLVHKKFVNFSENKREELLNYAFNDALLSFILYIRLKGYENNGATIKTLFFAFCKRKLIKMLRRKKGLDIVGVDISELNGIMEIGDDYNSESMKEVEKKAAEQERAFYVAWGQLKERCQKLLIWRKLKKWSDEKIAKELDMNPDIVTNEVYRCLSRLKNLSGN